MTSRPKGARGRRFESGLAPVAEEVNASVAFDQKLLPHDVRGSLAHARMLAAQGLISGADLQSIADGLATVEKRLASGELEWDEALEDVHMNVEARLTDLIGDAGRRLHTGRSRNDQVATDLRLYAISEAADPIALIDDLELALIAQAEAHIDWVMPGYTHLQRAQPIRVAHHLMAYVAMLERDRGRISDARKRASRCPLGAGALAGTTLSIDRSMVATELGFAGPTVNSLDTVGDRDFAVELVAAIALCQSHLSRLGEELCLWMSQEFQFARLSEQYCSGSSLMPQKVNPDLAELIRGKSGRTMGAWVTLMTVIKGLPLAYNKDLQETQEPLFDAVETLNASLRVATGMMNNLEFNRDRLSAAVSEGFLVATELADYLVSKGLPFRDAHDAAGALVRVASERGCELAALPLELMQEERPEFDKDVFDWLDVEQAINRRDLLGGPARDQVLAQVRRARELIAGR